MTQEEKAKAYDEAIEKAKKINSEHKAQPFDIMLKVFPELAESEDERIRKELVKLVRDSMADNAPYKAKMLAYLEKQKESNHKYYTYDDLMKAYSDGQQVYKKSLSEEQKEHLTVNGKKTYIMKTYKICPHCKSRMIRDDSKVYTSVPPKYGYNCPNCGAVEFDTAMYDNPKMEEQKPHFELKVGKWYICHHAFCSRADHLTVKEGERFQCEKDGIVKGFIIKEPEKYFIECSAPAPMEDEQKEQKELSSEEYANVIADEVVQGLSVGGEHITAIKELIRMAFMDGVKWGKEKEQKPLMSDGEIEDRKRDIVAAIRKFYKSDYAEYLTSFLKGLSPEDNSEDKYGQEMLGIAYKLMYEHIPENLRTQEFWNSLKFMREYTGKVAILRPYHQPAEWSEEDKKWFKEIELMALNFSNSADYREKFFNWLKSLRPQPHWKPTEEQMNALLKLEEMHVLEHENNQENARLYVVIKSLREQLSELRRNKL